jgi:O-acetylhomoserine/O-acetylserine sulfhydrylase
VFEKRLAGLEGRIAAVAASSGHAAQFLAIATIAEAGDNILSTPCLYGGTFNQFKVFFRRLGIEFKFIESDKPDTFAKAVDDRTRGICTDPPAWASFWLTRTLGAYRKSEIQVRSDGLLES